MRSDRSAAPCWAGSAGENADVHISQILNDDEVAQKGDWYCRNILQLANMPFYPRLTFYHTDIPAKAGVIVIENSLAMTVLLQDNEPRFALYSTEPGAVDEMFRYCEECLRDLPVCLCPVESGLLKRTNTRLDGYSFDGSLLFFLGGASVLLPGDVLDELALQHEGGGIFGLSSKLKQVYENVCRPNRT